MEAKRRPQKLSGYKALAIFLVILAALALLYFSSSEIALTPPPREIAISDVLNLVGQGKVEKVKVTGNTLDITLSDGSEVRSFKEPEESFLKLLAEHDLDPQKIAGGIVINDLTRGDLLNALLNIFPIVITIGFIILIMRQARNVGGDILSFGKSKARLFSISKDQPQVTFKDAAGVETAKKELQEVVDFLKNPQKYRALGARVPKGVLLVGPSGTGKTLLARAVAGEAGVPFFSMAGSEFMEMLVGVGSARVRDLFSTAKASAPSIIFIDEIESIGRRRGLGTMGGHGEQEQTLNQILTEMDGFESTTQVIVLAATNRPQLLDPALIRPGRFDRRVVLDLPDIEGREEIIRIHMRGKPFAKDFNIKRLAQRTVGFSGADIENMLNEAAILAARGGRKKIRASDLEDAATKVKLGPERKRLQSREERRMAAYHEAGHAVVSYHLPHTDPVHRVSIVSRGLALGFTMTTPERDRYNQTRTELRETIATLLGGRAAEELIFGEMTIGAGSDLERANELARRMVVQFGMSGLGPLSFSKQNPFNGWLYNFDEGGTDYSEETARRIDEEVKKIIDAAYLRAQKILKDQRQKLDVAAERLIKNETIERDEFEELMSAP
jgi:cell division protease FtsH